MKIKSKVSKEVWILLVIVLIGLALRIYSISSNNIILGFDQARDLFAAKTIYTNGDLKIIGPTAGNNTDLHHGIAWLYFILPFVFIGAGNPFVVSLGNSVFNLLVVFVLYELTKSIFNSKRTGFVAAFLVSVSYYFIQYAGWLSNPSPTLTTTALFFLGVWKYSEKKNWGLVLAFFALGLSIQFELFFIYLIPVFLLLWLVLRLKMPNLKTAVLALGSFCLVTSTMILTEIKFHFSGVKAILGAGNSVGGHESILTNLPKYVGRFLETFSQTLHPMGLFVSQLLGVVTIGVFVFAFVRARRNRQIAKPYLFCLIYLFSSATMLLLGYHGAPWFLIGLPGAIIVCFSFVLSKIRNTFLLISILFLILCSNVLAVSKTGGRGQILLEPDQGAIVADQLAAIDYTYQQSRGEQFSVNTVTNPLYINAVWGYHYDWYSKKYGYKPTWGGGDQLYPYNTLQSFTGKEKYIYLLMDQTPRIGEEYRNDARRWAVKQNAKFVEVKTFNGILVEKYILN